MFIAEKCRELSYHLLAYNNVEDHIHLLVSLRPTMCPADVAHRLKGGTSHFVNNMLKPASPLDWQDGYGVLSISERSVPIVVKYIQDQKLHHANKTLTDILERTTEL